MQEELSMDKQIRKSGHRRWIILLACILLITGVCIWGVFGRINVTLETEGVCKNGMLILYIGEADIGKVKTGMPFAIIGASAAVSDLSQIPASDDDIDYVITEISQTPVSVGSGADEYLPDESGLSSGGAVYEVLADTGLPDGIYSVVIRIGRVSPVSFLLK